MRKNVFRLTGMTGIAIILLSISVINVNADYKYDYYDHDEMVTLLENLEAQSSSLTPDVFSLQVIGNSHLGNPIHAVKFSDNPDIEEDDEPVVVIDACIHPDEWISSESAINFIKYLFDVYYDDQHADHAEVVDLVHNFEIWILPMINVDGRIRDDLNGGDPESFWTDPTYHSHDTGGWRMNVQEVDCPSMPGGTNIGIDLNRNWSRRFWEAPYSNCTWNNFSGGTHPISATESKVLKQFIHNHMVSLLFHQHSALNTLFSNSMTSGLGAYITVELDAVYEEEGLPDPLLALTNEIEMGGGGSECIKERDTATGSFLAGVCNGMGMTGQYFNWLWYEIDCILAPDNYSRRAIQCVFYEYPTKSADYGHPSEGKIGQYDPDDASNHAHPSSGDINEWIISRSVEMNKYFIKQSKYPFSPRYYTDMSLRPEAPTTDLAIVGAKISEVGTGLPGCFTYDSYGRDILAPGSKRITWNVQNNGTSNRTIGSEITICNLTDDPDCLSPTSAILTRNDVLPEVIETFTYDYAFSDAGACKDYSVTLITGESNSYNNDDKIFIFTVTSTGDDDCDGTPDGGDNCLGRPNGPVRGTCIKTMGDVVVNTDTTCYADELCGGDTCQMEQGDWNSNGIGDACDCNTDFDNDGNVYPSDLMVFLGEYGRTDCLINPPCQADIDGDGNVYPSDLMVFLGEYGKTSCPTTP